MKRSISMLLLAFAFSACQDEGPTVPTDGPQFAKGGAPPVYQVVGGGSIVREDLAGSPREIYGFNAKLDAAGNVKGQAEVHFPSDDVNMHIDVQCLVARGNEAWLSGPVTRSDDPLTPVGMVFVWRVVDNGQGKGAAPDEVSDFLYSPNNFPPGACIRQPGLITYPWDNGNVRINSTGNALSQADLVGTWDASTFVYVSTDNPADSLDRLAQDQRVRMTVAPDGRFSMVWWRVGEMFESIAGTMEVVNGQVLASSPEDDDVVGPSVGRIGQTLWIDTDAAANFDGDDVEDPARVFGVFQLKKTGVLIGDLVGVWDATVFRYVSTAAPADMVDLIAQGVSLTITIEPDSRWTVLVNDDDSDTSEWLIEGDQLLTRNGESQAFTFALEGDVLSMEAATTYDLDDNPGTEDEPATLEVVLVRR